MKIIKALSLLLMFTSLPVFSQNQTKEEKRAQKTESIKKMIESGNFEIAVSTANPSGGKIIHLSPDYSLIIRNDSAYSYLPYYGVAYSASYGGDNGIKFEQKTKNYKLVQKKKSILISFDVSAPKDFYNFNINIYSNGEATINVNSNNRRFISFSGQIKE